MFAAKREKNFECPVCGQPVKGWATVKIADGKLCRECSAKAGGMDVHMLPYQTAADMREYFAYREANRKRLQAFTTQKELPAQWNKILIDYDRREWHLKARKFAVTGDNPPVYSFDEVVDFELDERGYNRKLTTMQINITLNNKYNSLVVIPFRIAGEKIKFGSLDYRMRKMLADAILAEFSKMCSR